MKIGELNRIIYFNKLFNNQFILIDDSAILYSIEGEQIRYEINPKDEDSVKSYLGIAKVDFGISNKKELSKRINFYYSKLRELNII